MLKMIMYAAIVMAQVPTYGDCNPTEFKLKSIVDVPFALKPILSGGPIQVAGDVVIIDGCTFGVRNFVLQNAKPCSFYGGNKGTADGVLLSDDPAPSSAKPTNATFKLVSRPGAQTNFDSLNEIRLFQAESNILLAVASLSGPGVPSSSVTTTSGTVASPTNVKPSTSGSIGSGITFASVFLSFLL